jgi:hypothetical protein
LIFAVREAFDRRRPARANGGRHDQDRRLKEKIARLEGRWGGVRHWMPPMHDAPDQQISLTDPDAHSMATSGRGSRVVGYNVEVAVDTEHHLRADLSSVQSITN